MATNSVCVWVLGWEENNTISRRPSSDISIYPNISLDMQATPLNYLVDHHHMVQLQQLTINYKYWYTAQPY